MIDYPKLRSFIIWKLLDGTCWISKVKKSWRLVRYAVICSSNVGPSIVWHIFENVWVLAHVEDIGVDISNLSSEVVNSLRLLR